MPNGLNYYFKSICDPQQHMLNILIEIINIERKIFLDHDSVGIYKIISLHNYFAFDVLFRDHTNKIEYKSKNKAIQWLYGMGYGIE